MVEKIQNVVLVKTTYCPRVWLSPLSLWLLLSLQPLAAIAGDNNALEMRPGQAIQWSEIGARAGTQYQGDGLSVRAFGTGALLRCVFQKLQAKATTEGLWLTSTVPGGAKDRFRVMASSVGRSNLPSGEAGTKVGRCVPPALETEGVLSRKCSFGLGRRSALPCFALPTAGTVQVADNLVRFIRPGVIEEYSVSMDGVRQDFVIEQKPDGAGELRVELNVSGARVEATAQGARLVLDNSGRKIAYSRLRATDATGRELPARIEVASNLPASINHQPSTLNQLSILVNDVGAVYPVRIDPVFSDEDWVSMGGIPGANNDVYATAVDRDGNLFIGGRFLGAGNVSANRIAKWDGSTWSALGSGVEGTVKALLVIDNELYVGGSFTAAGGVTNRNRIVKWQIGGTNDSSWSALGSGVGGTVNALAVKDNKLFVAGAFTTAGNVPSRNRIAKWEIGGTNDGSWSALGLGLDRDVNALAVKDNYIYAGGAFRTAGGIAADCIARWDGSGYSALGSGLNTNVYALVVAGGDLYAGGAFTNAGGIRASCIAKWDSTNWSGLGSGVSGWGVNTVVFALAVKGDALYVGGRFTKAGGDAWCNYIANWMIGGTTDSSWSHLYLLGVDHEVYTLAVFDGGFYAGGSFGTAGGKPASRIAQWTGSSWMPLGSGFGDSVYALAVAGSDLYAGGAFTTAGRTAVNRIARWDGTNWSALGSGISGSYGYVSGLAVSGSNLYVGGAFTTAGTNVANYIAKWTIGGSNDDSWSALGTGVSSPVYALTVKDDALYIGGAFTVAGNVSGQRNHIAKWTIGGTDNSSWSALGSGVNFDVYALAAGNDALYVGGAVTLGAGLWGRVAKWTIGGTDDTSWSALGAGFDGPVRALAVSGSNLYAAGTFNWASNSVYSSVTASQIAGWDGSVWSGLNSAMNGGVNSLAVFGTDLYVGGAFTTAGGTAANRTAKWDGSHWSGLASGVNNVVSALAVSGRTLYVGGAFTIAGGKVSGYVAKALLVLPANAVSSFPDGGDFTVWFDGSPNVTYTIEYTPEASPANWQKLTNMTAPSTDQGLGVGVFKFRDAVQPSGQRFYRTVYPAY